MICLVLVIVTQIYHSKIMHIHKWVDIETTTKLIILLMSLVLSGAKVCATLRPSIGTPVRL